MSTGIGTSYAKDVYVVNVKKRITVIEPVLIIIISVAIFGGGGFYWKRRSVRQCR